MDKRISRSICIQIKRQRDPKFRWSRRCRGGVEAGGGEQQQQQQQQSGHDVDISGHRDRRKRWSFIESGHDPDIALTAAGVDVIIGLGEPSATLISGVVELIPLGRTVVSLWQLVPASVEAQVIASALGSVSYFNNPLFSEITLSASFSNRQ